MSLWDPIWVAVILLLCCWQCCQAGKSRRFFSLSIFFFLIISIYAETHQHKLRVCVFFIHLATINGKNVRFGETSGESCRPAEEAFVKDGGHDPYDYRQSRSGVPQSVWVIFDRPVYVFKYSFNATYSDVKRRWPTDYEFSSRQTPKTAEKKLASP